MAHYDAIIIGAGQAGPSLALRLAGGRGRAGAVVIAGTELLAAAFVLVLGLSLLLGLSTLAPSS